MSSIQNVESDIHDNMGNSIGVNIIDSEYVEYTNADSNVNLQLVDNEYVNTVNIDSNVNLQLVDGEYVNTTNIDNIISLSSGTHTNVNTLNVNENITFNGVDMSIGILDTAYLNNTIDKIDHINDIHKSITNITTDTLVMMDSLLIDKSLYNQELHNLYSTINIEPVYNILSVDSINLIDNRYKIENHSELNFCESLILSDRKSEQLISYNSGYIYDVSYKSVNKAELSSGLLVNDINEQKSISKIGTKSFTHLEDQINKGKNQTEADAYQHLMDDSWSDINVIYGRLSFIQHTSDVTDFRIFEKLSSNTNINHINYNEDDVNDVIGSIESISEIQHNIDYNNSDELSGEVQVTDIKLILGNIDIIDNRISLSGGYQSPDNIDYTSSINTIYNASHNPNNTDHVSGNVSVNSIWMTESVDNISISITTDVSSIYHINNNTDGVSSCESIDSLYITNQLDTLGSVVDIMGISHEYQQTDKLKMSTDMSSVNFSRYDIGESTFELTTKNIDVVFGDSHDIGIVIGVGDDNSTTYVSTPVMFDMSILGVNQSETTPQSIPLNVKLSDINTVNSQFNIGAEVIMSGVDYTIHHNGSIGCITNVSNINHSNNTHKTMSRVGLYLLSHIRDICYFDNTDTFTWDNEIKTWDNDPEPV